MTTFSKPQYWVLDQPFRFFDDARVIAREEADLRGKAVPVRASHLVGPGGGREVIRIACDVRPTVQVLGGRS